MSRGEVQLVVDGLTAGTLGQMLLVLEHHWPSAKVTTLGAVLGTVTVELGDVVHVHQCWQPEPDPEPVRPAGRTFTVEDRRFAVGLIDKIGVAAAAEEVGVHPDVLRAWEDAELWVPAAVGDDDRQVTAGDGDGRAPRTPAMVDLAERTRQQTAVLAARGTGHHPAKKSSQLVESGVAHPVDHDAARKRAYPHDDEQ